MQHQFRFLRPMGKKTAETNWRKILLEYSQMRSFTLAVEDRVYFESSWHPGTSVMDQDNALGTK